MAVKPVVLLDLNILMDVLQKREPYFQMSAGVLAAAETGRIHAYVAAHSITTLFYLIQKGRSAADARGVITNLLQFIRIAPVSQGTIEQALNLAYPDLEDAVQMISAVQCKADCLITRNAKDYQPALLPIFQPAEFLASL
jgi:hypothetical protein